MVGGFPIMVGVSDHGRRVSYHGGRVCHSDKILIIVG